MTWLLFTLKVLLPVSYLIVGPWWLIRKHWPKPKPKQRKRIKKQINKSDMKQVLVSLKHTDPTDDFITFWGPDNAGYAMNENRIGVYEQIQLGYHDSDETLPFPHEKLQMLFIEVTVEGKQQKRVPNCKAIWKHLGIKPYKGYFVRKQQTLK